MGLTGKFSLSHDTLARSVFNSDFLTKNPEFEFMRDQIAQCRGAYDEEVKKKGCSCRVDSRWSEPCLDVILSTLEQANKTNHEMVRRFVRFVSHKPDEVDVDGLGVNVIYRDKTYSIFIDKETETTPT